MDIRTAGVRVHLRWVLLLTLLCVAGCGGSEPEAPEPQDSAPAAAAPTGPVVPDAGVVRVRIFSRESLPSLEAVEPVPMTLEERRAIVETGLMALMDSPERLVCEALPATDRVRFWIAREGGIEEEAAVAAAEQLAADFLASAEARFQDRIEVALGGLNARLDSASTQLAQMQTTLRDYLDLHQARAGTAETRLEERELRRDFDRLTNRVGEMQALRDRLTEMRDKGQPWYRRVE